MYHYISMIEKVQPFKYLGIVLDSTLSCTEHINVTHNKACRHLGALRKVRNCLDQKTSLTLYKSLSICRYLTTLIQCT